METKREPIIINGFRFSPPKEPPITTGSKGKMQGAITVKKPAKKEESKRAVSIYVYDLLLAIKSISSNVAPWSVSRDEVPSPPRNTSVCW